MAYLSDDKIAELASRMRVADPTKDLGAFDSISVQQAAIWLSLLGVKPARDLPVPADDVVKMMLRKALWDSQRWVVINVQVDASPRALRPIPNSNPCGQWIITLYRLDYLFLGKKISELKSDKLTIAEFKSWPGWRDGHRELHDRQTGVMKMDGFKDAERMNS